MIYKCEIAGWAWHSPIHLARVTNLEEIFKRLDVMLCFTRGGKPTPSYKLDMLLPLLSKHALLAL